MAASSGNLDIERRVAPTSLAISHRGKGLEMAEKPKHDEAEELDESELEEQDGEPLPDREAMSIISPTPFVSPPGITLPVEPPD
jgi:hypothetical protein